MRFFRTSPEKLPAAESEMIFSKQDLKQLLLPLLAEQFLVVLIGMMDTIMVSYCGMKAMSGVSLVDGINVLLIGVFSALATGGAVLVSQYLGKKRPDAAKTAAKMLFYVVLLVSLAIMAICLIFRKPLLLTLFGNVEDEVMAASQAYFLMSALSYPVMAIYNAYCALLRCIGNPRATMFSSFIMNIVNLVGNAVTIYLLGWGVVGAGLATLISRSVGAYITQRALRDPHCRIPYPGMSPFEWHPSEVKKILSVGIPSGFENGLFQLGKLLLLSMIATFGTASTAANTVGNTLGSFQCLPGNAIGLAMIAWARWAVAAARTPTIRRNSTPRNSCRLSISLHGHAEHPDAALQPDHYPAVQPFAGSDGACAADCGAARRGLRDFLADVLHDAERAPCGGRREVHDDGRGLLDGGVPHRLRRFPRDDDGHGRHRRVDCHAD